MSDDSAPERTFDLGDSFGPAAHEGAGEVDPVEVTENRPQRYAVGELLGEGGVGSVRRVYDRALRRDVALKRLRPGASSAARFVWEARVTGRLEHPNIVPVHDVGEDEEGPWFTMKQVRGRALSEEIEATAEAVAAGRLPVARATLRLVRALEKVCEAMAFAHAQGVLHLDLKPDNVMVGEFGEVQVMDWGLARELDGGRAEGGVAGTPGYMAPEQARGEPVGVAADVHALGAMLAHALGFGLPELEGAPEARLAAARGALSVDPAEERRRRLGPDAPPPPRALLAVADRATSAAPEDRHPSVEALLEDLRAWLEDRPLGSLQYSASERALLWARRNRAAVLGAVATGVVAALFGAGGLVKYLSDLEAARAVAVVEAGRAHEAEQGARLQLAQANIATADALLEQGAHTQASALYAEAIAQLRDLGQPDLGARLGQWAAAAQGRAPALRVQLPSAAQWIALHPSGDRALVLDRGALHRLRLRPERALEALPLPGEGLKVGLREGRLVSWSVEAGALVERDADSGEERRWAAPFPSIHRASPLPGGGLVVGGGLQDGVVWLDADGERLHHVEGKHHVSAGPGGLRLLGRSGHGYVLVDGVPPETLLELGAGDELWAQVSPDGARMVLYSQVEGALRCLTLPGGEEVWSRPFRNGRQMVFEPGGGRLAVSGLGEGVSVLDAQTGALEAELALPGRPRALAFAPDGRLLALLGDGQLWGWALDAAPPDRPFPATEGVTVSDLSPDGRLVASASEGVTVWDVATRSPLVQLGPEEPIFDIRFDDDGDGVIVVYRAGELRWFGLDGVERARWSGGARLLSAAALPGDRGLLIGDAEGQVGTLSLAQLADGAPLTLLGRHDSAVWHVAPSPTGEQALSVGFKDERLRVWSLERGEEAASFPLRAISYRAAWGPEGRRIAVGGRDGSVLLVDLEAGRQWAIEAAHQGPVLDVDFSADGRWVASAGFDWTAGVWSAEGGALLRRLGPRAGALATVRWAPAGEALLLSGDAGELSWVDPGLAAALDVDPAHPAWAWSLVLKGDPAEALAALPEGGPWLERARVLHLLGQGEAAAAAYRAAADAGEAPAAYLALCAQAATR